MKRRARVAAALAIMSLLPAASAAGQVQVRVGDSSRATYSELHEALKEGTPTADSMLMIQRSISCMRVPGRFPRSFLQFREKSGLPLGRRSH